MDATQTETAATVAAVDLGSNSFHMIVAQPVGGQLRIIDRMRETVRLATGLSDSTELASEARERALACLQRFGQRLRALPSGSVRVVGTDTLRKARNAREFLEAASGALGHPVEVIAGREEARLIYLGVSHSLPDSGQNHLVIDIGGGSTEVIIGKRFDALHRESLFMGCVSYSEAYFPKGVVGDAAMTEAVLAARLELEPVEMAYRRIGWDDAIGASGSIKAIAQIAKEMGWSGDGITLEALRQIRAALIKAGNAGKVELKGLKDDRRPVLAGGLAVLIALFEALGIERMQVSEWALREGLLFDLVGRIRHEDVRERTIEALTGQYAVDMAQAQRVRRTSLGFLDQVKRDWALGAEEDGNLLAWAANLHEIGLAVAHASHHKHAAYLIANSDLPGFSREEQRLLAAIVRAHRRKLPLAELKELPAAAYPRALRLTVLLRLAVALHRSRSDTRLPKIGVSANEKGVKLTFPTGWLDAHPLTRADLEVEAELLKPAKLKLAFG